MILSKEEIKDQTRLLWKECFHDSEDFMDIYFEEKYSDSSNLTFRVDGGVAAAVQVFPYRTTFYGNVIHSGYISGLATAPAFRGKGIASQLLRDAHRKLYKEGAALSFIIPEDEQLRHFYENVSHGAYWSSTFRKETEIVVSGEIDEKIEITQPDDWGHNLYVFFRQHTLNQPFMLHPSENDFFAALATCDEEGGMVLVAHRKQRLLGICLAVMQEDGRCMLRSLLATDEKVKDSFIHYLRERLGIEHVYAHIAVPGSIQGATPYAMARVIDVEKILKSILAIYPTFQLHVGVDGDLDIPENNGYYLVDDGKVTITDEKPETIVTPGGLAAMLLGAHPVSLEMMLDE